MMPRVRAGWLVLFALGVLLTVTTLSAVLSLDAAPLPLRALGAVSAVLTAESLRRAFSPNVPSASLGSARFGFPPVGWGEKNRDLGKVYLGDYEGRSVSLPRSLALRHGFILGPTGSGKSRGFFFPNLMHGERRSVVCADPKSELWRYTSGFHANALRFAPGDPDASACFNWVPLCADARMAERIARSLVESGQTRRTEQVWLDLEAGFLAALFAHAATLTTPTPLSAYRLLTGQKPDALLKSFDDSPSEIAREQANLLRQTTERIRGSVVPVVAARLQFLRDPAVARFTSAIRTPPDFSRLRLRPHGVYWCLHESEMTRLRPLSAVFFTVLIEQLMTESEEKEGAVPISLFLDEFACIGPIPDFDTLIAVARGRGLAFWLGIQSLAQLESRYGKPAARTILTNCQTKLFLPGLDVDSAGYLSRSLGEETRPALRRSWQYRFLSLLPGSLGVGEVEHSRALLTADESRRLPENSLIAIVGNQRPLLLTRKEQQPSRTGTPRCPPLGEPLTIEMPVESRSAANPMPELPDDL